ncbi:MAG: glycosyltransferase family 4 protein [Deltaproteobacteria bacterium]|nr:glycosyltransferase family 4 protein [Deltaproteobacteria bacterium]
MRKIGIVSEYFYPHLGGVTEHVYYFSKEMLRRGFEIVLLTGYEGQEKIDVELPPGLRIIRFGKSVPIFSNHSFAKVTLGWNLAKKVKRVLAEEKFDLLHVHSPVMPVLPGLFQKYTNTVTIGTFHTYFDAMDSKFFYWALQSTVQKYLDKLDGKIAVGSSCIEAMDAFFKADYTIIPNGVATDWFAQADKKIAAYDDSDKNILFLGRLDPRNGLDTLLDAFPSVLEKVPDARLMVAGDGPLREYYEKKSGDLLGKKVFFEGQVNGNRPEYFATCDAFCFPATKAGFSITILEAMAAGKPIITTDTFGFRDVIRNGENGLLVPQGDSAELGKALVKVLQKKDFAAKLSKNAQSDVQQYSWSQVTDRVIDYYNQVFMKKKGVPFVS